MRTYIVSKYFVKSTFIYITSKKRWFIGIETETYYSDPRAVIEPATSQLNRTEVNEVRWVEQYEQSNGGTS